MVWLLPNDGTFTIYPVKPDLTGLIEVEELPEGIGILRQAEDGTFYYEPFPEPEVPGVNPEVPITPEPPVLSIEEMQAKILLNTEMLLIQKEIGV